MRDFGIYIDSDLSTPVHVQRSVVVASQSYVSYAAFDDLSRHLCISRWLLPWSCRGWTTLMRHWLVFRPACLTVSSLSSTRQLGRSSVSGFKRPSASSSNWRSLCTELFTVLHLSTYRASFSTSLICRRDIEAGCARRPPVSLTSVRRDLLLSAIVRLLLPARDSGTVFLSTSSLPRHSQHFVGN